MKASGVVLLAFSMALLPSTVVAQQQGIYDPGVFNWRFYLNAHSDLLMAGISDPQGARVHWRDHGIAECRRAHPTFHSSQYLERYADLRTAYGTDCAKALNHYLVYGRSERRVGLNGTYYSGPHGSRVTIKSDLIAIGMSSRTAGAIDSRYAGGYEYINSWDRGRQMQIAWTVNGTGECNNPTEAGSSSDGVGHNTSSRWTSRYETSNSAHTSSRPAFWLKPGDRSDCNGVTQLSGHLLTKHVTIGVPGVSERLVEIVSEVTIPAATGHLVVENPALYLAPEFNTFHALNVADCSLSSLQSGAGEQGRPVIASIAGGAAAIGLWSPDLPSSGFSTVGYGRAFFPRATPADSTAKINAVYRRSNIGAGTYYQQTYVAVGSLTQASMALCQAAQKL